MHNSEYTEQDFQDYLDGTFKGDVKAFELFLEENEAAQKRLAYYRLLAQLIQQRPEPVLSYDLANRVVEKIEVKKEKLIDHTFIFYVTTISFLVIAIFIIWPLLSLPEVFASIESLPLSMACMVGVMAFLVVFHFIEVKVKQQKFRF